MTHLLIVGCGAITESFYAPALQGAARPFDAVTLVDRDVARAQKIASLVPGAAVAPDLAPALAACDAVVVATPHHSHVPLATQALEAGRPVLVEKPLATTAQDAEALVALARRKGLALMVNNTRRLFPSFQRAKAVVAEGGLGRLERATFLEGGPFRWPTTSGFYFSGESRRMGVLLDKGAHGVDLLAWWMGRPDVVACRTDSHGGPEALAAVDLECAGVPVHARFSWLAKMENRFTLVGEEATLAGNVYDWRNLTLTRGRRTRKVAAKDAPASYAAFGARLLADFAAAAAGRAEPSVPGAAVVDSIRCIEESYARAQPLPEPWYDEVRDG